MARAFRTSGTRQRAFTLSVVVLGALGLVASAAVQASAEGPWDSPAPLHTGRPGDVLAGQYIVVMKDGQSVDDAVQRAGDRGGRVHRRFSHALHGYAAELSTEQLAAVRNDPAVSYVEPDQVVHADTTTEDNADWGLDRIDQRGPVTGNPYQYTYAADGTGVTAYVIDTGIYTQNSDFGGRAIMGTSFITGDTNNSTDCNGHGTHVAGTIGGTTYGVAKKVTLVGVRVLDCNGSGSNSGVIAGIDWVARNHAKPAVANLSLGGGASTAVDDAIARLTGAGVTVTVSAGNSAADACGYSPARAASAITVGATTNTDSRDTSYSNYGPCVDVFAPGTGITSDWKGAANAINTLSGTSMASPHVAGVAALFLQKNAGASSADVAAAITTTATPSVLSSVGTGSPNLLVFSGLTAPTTGSTSPPPPVTPACGSGTATTYTGTLTRNGWAYSPNIATPGGTLTGCLSGPANTNFDLYLYQLSGSRWNQVALSNGQTSTETVSYPGARAGTYRWGVKATSGSGLATLISMTP